MDTPKWQPKYGSRSTCVQVYSLGEWIEQRVESLLQWEEKPFNRNEATIAYMEPQLKLLNQWREFVKERM